MFARMEKKGNPVMSALLLSDVVHGFRPIGSALRSDRWPAQTERRRNEADQKRKFFPIHVPYSAWLPAPLLTPCLFTWRISAKLRGEGFAQPVVPAVFRSRKGGCFWQYGSSTFVWIENGRFFTLPSHSIHSPQGSVLLLLYTYVEGRGPTSFPLPTKPAPLPSSPECVSCRNA